VLGADEAGVWDYRLAHPLDGAVQLGIELSTDFLAQALPQSLGLLAELLARLTSPARQDKKSEAGDQERRRYPRYVRRRRCGDRHECRPETKSADLDRGRLGDGALQGEGELLRLVFAVVALDDVSGVLADGVEQLRAVVLEVVADLPDDLLVVPNLSAAVDVSTTARHCFRLRSTIQSMSSSTRSSMRPSVLATTSL
jgi:hypothetical protein